MSLPPFIDRRWPAPGGVPELRLNYLTGQTFDSPQAWTRLAAYMDPASLNMPAALCGSEGTLGVLVGPKCGWCPPHATARLLLSFESVADACTATVGLLDRHRRPSS
jgi:hypothetical protein